MLVLFLTLCLEAKALTFERGGVANSPGIVDKNSLQLELGFVNYQKSFSSSKNFSYSLAAPLFRYGLIDDRLELRLLNSGVYLDRNDTLINDLAPGFKLNLLSEDKHFITTDLISHFFIPLTNQADFNHRYEFIINRTIGKKNNFLTNINFNFAHTNSKTFASMPYVFELNRSLTDKLVFLVELFGSWSITNSNYNPLGFAYGFTYQVNDKLAFDITNTWGLNDDADDFGLSAGMVYSFF